MQILPSSKQESLGDHLFATAGRTSEEGSSFADELQRHQDAQQAVDAGEAFSVTSAQAQAQSPSPTVEVHLTPETSKPLTEAPYSRSTNNGVTYTLEEVSFTKKDIQELYRKMEQAGAPAESLKDLAKLAQQPDGATLAQVIASLHVLQNPPQLSDAEKDTIKSVCGRMDTSGKLGTEVLDLMAKGQGKQALELLTQAMNQQDSGFRLTLEKDEAAALAKGLNLSTTAQKQLQGNFGPYPSLSLDAADFQRFMGAASNDFAQRASDQQKLDKALAATLQPILSKAKARMEAEKAAGELSNRRTEQSKALIEKTVLRNVNSTLENTQAAQAEQQMGVEKPGRGQSALTGQAGQAGQDKAGQAAEPRVALASDKAAAKDEGKEGLRSAQAGQTGPTNQAGPAGQTAQSVGENTRQNDGKGLNQHTAKDDGRADYRHDLNKRDGGKDGTEENIWGDMLGKTEVRASAAPTTATATTASLVGAAGLGGLGGLSAVNTALENIAATQPAGRGDVSRQMVNQVEQSMLSAMRDGTKRLELQLHPGELGNLTLMLTMRNGEVSATIRSEKGETADMLNRQLDMLRTQLEQQGVKVDKLEVQTQTPDNNSRQQWDGMQQHNARQEEYARRDDLERLRNLGRVRNNNENIDDITLEQGVQSQRYTAGNAAQSLHIVT